MSDIFHYRSQTLQVEGIKDVAGAVAISFVDKDDKCEARISRRMRCDMIV